MRRHIAFKCDGPVKDEEALPAIALALPDVVRLRFQKGTYQADAAEVIEIAGRIDFARDNNIPQIVEIYVFRLGELSTEQRIIRGSGKSWESGEKSRPAGRKGHQKTHGTPKDKETRFERIGQTVNDLRAKEASRVSAQKILTKALISKAAERCGVSISTVKNALRIRGK